LPQPLYGLDEVVSLTHQSVELGLDVALLVLRPQVDGSELLALAPGLIERRLEAMPVRNLVAGGEAGKLQGCRRSDGQRLLDLPGEARPPLPQPVEPFITPDLLFPGGRKGSQRLARQSVGRCETRLRFCQPVGRCAPCRLGVRKAGQERATP